ncbi:tryptophan 7-halogenase [Sphingomonas sp. 28-62-20]|uniref:tryptophan 7-halogenase n=1 Tax=Sphingomonas sp. 28-62-20 TaxID=1970433 RepID=UPI002680E306
MTKARFRIVILGGGTAGWIAANLFAHGWGKVKGNRFAQITVVESPDIGSIGGYYSAIS